MSAPEDHFESKDMPHHLRVVQLYDGNSRDPVYALRKIADQIEAGEYGDVGSVGVALMGDTLEIFGMGDDCTGPSIAALFQAGILRLIEPMVRHGR